MKKILMLALFVSSGMLSFAADISATTVDGRGVILHENGTWEYYQRNTKIRDIRESAIPEDQKFQVTIKYEKYEQLKKDLETYLDAMGVPEEQIRDSVRTLPRGGKVHFQVKTEQIKKGLPRTFVYSIWQGGKSPIYQEILGDSTAVQSEQAGISDLVVVPIFSKPKKDMKAQVKTPDSRQTLDFVIPIK